MSNHLFDALMSRGDRAAPALSTLDGAVLTYAALDDRVACVAGALLGLGVKPGDRVAAQVEKSPDALMLYLATVKVGAVFLPLNTAYTTAELAYFLDDAEPGLVVCDLSATTALASLNPRSIATLDAGGQGSLRDLADAATPLTTAVPRAEGDLAAILYTSGTTGRSKGAMLTHGNLVSNAETLVDLWRFEAGDVLLHALPIYHTHGLFVACNTVMRAGASMIFLPKFDAGAVLRALPRATTMMGVPTFYTRLLDTPGFGADVAAHLRLFTSGSAPLLAETHRAWSARTGHAILERYGMTETNMTTSNPYDRERRAGTVGVPLPGVAVRVVDGGAPVAPGGVGMIEVRGPNVFAGYWRNPEKTAAEFTADGFFITGDLGTVDADGYVSIVGRGKDLIISGGFNVYPKEVELEIDAIEGVAESAVVGVPHADLGEGVAAVVVPHADASLDERAILAALDGRLAKFKRPKRVIFLPELPRNTMGKVQKAALRETFKSLFSS